MKTAYIGGIVLDGTKDMAPQKGMTVVVENGRIKELLSSEELIPSDCEIVHLQGSYLMPGLINLHVHLNSSGKPSARKKTPEDYVRLVKLATSNPVTGNLVRSMIRGFAFTELQSGVTTIRTVGGIADYDGKLRNEIEEGCLFREREWKAGSSTLWKGSSPLRAARTGISRIPIGSLAPEGIGAAFRKGTHPNAKTHACDIIQTPFIKRNNESKRSKKVCGVERLRRKSPKPLGLLGSWLFPRIRRGALCVTDSR